MWRFLSYVFVNMKESLKSELNEYIRKNLIHFKLF